MDVREEEAAAGRGSSARGRETGQRRRRCTHKLDQPLVSTKVCTMYINRPTWFLLSFVTAHVPRITLLSLSVLYLPYCYLTPPVPPARVPAHPRFLARAYQYWSSGGRCCLSGDLWRRIKSLQTTSYPTFPRSAFHMSAPSTL